MNSSFWIFGVIGTYLLVLFCLEIFSDLDVPEVADIVMVFCGLFWLVIKLCFDKKG